MKHENKEASYYTYSKVSKFGLLLLFNFLISSGLFLYVQISYFHIQK